VCVLGASLVAGGCGVQAHPRGDAAPVDSSNDFGPAMGIPTGTGGAAPFGSGGTPVVVGQGGIPQSVGGLQPGSGGVPSTAGSTGIAGAVPTGGVVGAGGVGGLPVTAGGAAGAAGAAGAPPSGITITLGNNTVAKEDAIAFIHFGHSNMAGRAIGPTATRPYFFMNPDPHGWMYHVGTPPQPALEPYTAEDIMTTTYGGPGTAIIKEAAALAPSKYFISLGFGKESAYCSQFLPGALYYDSLIAAAKAIKDRVTFGAIIVLLGITERHGTSADITGYSTCINNLVTAVRNDVGRPDLPLLICDYEMTATGALAATGTFAQQIIPEIHKIPMVVSNSAIVPTDGLTLQDDHHFDFDGHKEYVRRMLQIMKDRGWFPWN
jgi:hypothetical protein